MLKALIGLGIVLGGIVSERLSYPAAFGLAFTVNAMGVAYFWLYVRNHFKANKLR